MTIQAGSAGEVTHTDERLLPSSSLIERWAARYGAGVPAGVVIGVSSAILTALITEIYCHRCLAHRAFRTHPVLASLLDTYFRVIVWTDPESWAAVHRLHHRFADTPSDPHSPLQRRPLTILIGSPYLFAAARRRLPDDPPPARGIVALRGLVVAFYFVTFGLVQLLTMLAVHLVCYLGIMGSVNTVGHLYGRKPHPDVPGYDMAWLAIPLLGHGYHNSHHAHPASARTGALDPIWPLLRLLAALRLIDLEGRRAPTPTRACCGAAGLPRRRSAKRRVAATGESGLSFACDGAGRGMPGDSELGGA